MAQIWNITMPGLLPTIVLMLILKVGYILETGFEQVLVFYNPAVYEVADIIQTYVYRLGMGQMDFPLSTALGLVQLRGGVCSDRKRQCDKPQAAGTQHLVRKGMQ